VDRVIVGLLMARLGQLKLERPDSEDAVELITELEAHLDPLYPAASRHGYSVEKLVRQGVFFFIIRDRDALIGCGGVQFCAPSVLTISLPANTFPAPTLYVLPRYE